MSTTNAKLSSRVLSEDSLPETDISMAELELPDDIHFDTGDLYIVPFKYLCTVHSKLYNNSALSVLRAVFNL